VAEEGEVVGAGEPGRPRAHDRDLAAGRLLLQGDQPGDHRLELVGEEHGVRDDPVHVPHVDRLVHRGAPAAVLAGVLADTPGGGGERVVEDDREEGVLEIALLVELEEPRDVHVDRARVLAGADGEVLADPRPAALDADVVLELVPEVPQVVSTGFGALWPSPQSEVSRTMRTARRVCPGPRASRCPR